MQIRIPLDSCKNYSMNKNIDRINANREEFKIDL